MYRKFADFAIRMWRATPLAPEHRFVVKNLLFTALPFVFRRTQTYHDWKTYKDDCLALDLDAKRRSLISESLEEPTLAQALSVEHTEPYREHVPLFRGQPLKDKPARLVCFYLPQFHPIPENDEWWGKGFTDWDNVRTAQPQFVGHYQPHLPGELGYYNLLDPAVQRRQVELATLYGIEGFCFYFYWFGGKRLLEAPLLNYLKDPSLSLPFCLCWANENWSRRWDGLDNDLLIQQHHSKRDDLAFIQYVSRYMRDPRYIRIDGKPLLLVYRPRLLPDARKTARAWRKWCRSHGIGEIYLAYTQSFERVDPAFYDFDAAVEFPPINSALLPVGGSVTPLRETFSSHPFDWRILVARSRAYKKPSYRLFRGVNPGWDNTARRKKGGSVLINSSPRGYQEWLINAVADTYRRFEAADERLIFVNAWNEWAEGAHLEPDMKYGYAYLEASRMALARYNAMLAAAPTRRPAELAVVVHAFYVDTLDEILEFLGRIESAKLSLFVTCPLDREADVLARLQASGLAFQLKSLANRGRDVLPFLKTMPQVIEAGHEFIVKVHTKRSTHHHDGTAWRRDLLQKLLTDQAIDGAFEHFAQYPDTGLLGPHGHVVPMSNHWNLNAVRIQDLAARLGLDRALVHSLPFVAGTMFFARTRAFVPLLNLALSEEDFEEESGQVDGTMAHALERAMSISARAACLLTREERSADPTEPSGKFVQEMPLTDDEAQTPAASRIS
jgi:lipopolysaccharide biosynthesis protein